MRRSCGVSRYPAVRANGMRMPVLALADAAALLPERGALIGLDLGTKTIGVAASDPDRRVAAPVETIARKRFALDARRILALAAERRATGFVLGLPINMDGIGRAARAIDPRLCPQSGAPDRAADRAVGRAAVDRCRRARADRRRCEPRRAQKRSSISTRPLHLAGRARPVVARAVGKTVTRLGPLRFASFRCIATSRGRSALAG